MGDISHASKTAKITTYDPAKVQTCSYKTSCFAETVAAIYSVHICHAAVDDLTAHYNQLYSSKN